MNILLYVIIAILSLVIIAFIVYNIIKIAKMPEEERKKILRTYLKGLVAEAEKAIGAGHGDVKFAQVEEWFNKKAPMIYKIILMLLGKDNLKDLIDDALKEIKESFEK